MKDRQMTDSVLETDLVLVQSADTPFKGVHFIDLMKSMTNGGEPRCVRLRIVLTEKERNTLLPFVFFTPALHNWIKKHYSDELIDPNLYHRCCVELNELMHPESQFNVLISKRNENKFVRSLLIQQI